MKSINQDEFAHVLRKIGLYSPENHFYPDRERKYHQALAYIRQLMVELNKLSTKRPLVLLDACCGRSYVSFILYAFCTEILKRPLKIIGVDFNADLIEQNRKIAKDLGFEGMSFYASNLIEFKLTQAIDIVYSLHACNYATDYVIATGVLAKAKYIFSVSCCQHSNSNSLKKHPLQSATRFRPYKERIADIVGDTLRALLLEHHGYKVNIFEFVGNSFTQKNVMIKASLGHVRKVNREKAMKDY